jgi:hypothetical protein
MGRLEVWKVPVAGGQAIQITSRGGFAAFESQDGKTLYYAKGIDIDGLWSVPVNGGMKHLCWIFPKVAFVATGLYRRRAFTS